MILALAAALWLAPSLLIHRSAVDISPPEPLPLGGYTERHGKVMEPGGEPLFARCILLHRGDTEIAIVVADTLTIPESLYREVAARLPKSIHLFLQATHTHSAPDSQMLNDRMTFAVPGIASFKRRWLTWYADKLASAGTTAAASQPEETEKLEMYGRRVDANRARRNGGKPEKAIYFAQGVSPLFAYYTAHGTIYGPDRNTPSGDWLGRAAQRFGVPVLNGAIGDVSPAADGATPAAKMDDFFRRLDKGLGHSFPRWQPFWTSDKPVLWAERAVTLDGKRAHPTFGKTNGVPDAIAKTLVEKFAPLAATVTAIRLGDLAIVGIPGEPTSILGNGIAANGRKLGFKSVLVCSHVNGWMGYILDSKDYDRGGYEATLSFYGREEGAKVVDAATTALRQLRQAR